MKGILVDASVTANWLLRETYTPTTEWVIDRIQDGVQVSVPNLWLLEMTNVIFTAERRKRISKEQREIALEQVERLPFTILAAPTLSDLRILRLYSERHQLTAYDAEYLRVAKEQKLILATQDGNLLAAATREKVSVAGVS